ncbi:hypothetical protein PRIC2_012571 [Phytophthora ramorum]
MVPHQVKEYCPSVTLEGQHTKGAPAYCEYNVSEVKTMEKCWNLSPHERLLKAAKCKVDAAFEMLTKLASAQWQAGLATERQLREPPSLRRFYTDGDCNGGGGGSGRGPQMAYRGEEHPTDFALDEIDN